MTSFSFKNSARSPVSLKTHLARVTAARTMILASFAGTQSWSGGKASAAKNPIAAHFFAWFKRAHRKSLDRMARVRISAPWRPMADRAPLDAQACASASSSATRVWQRVASAPSAR